MTPIQEFLNILAETAERECGLSSSISLKELPAAGGIYAEAGEGFAESRYYSKKEVRMVPVLFLCRDADQERCLGQLEAISLYFSRLKRYPQGESFFWLDTATAKTPSKIGRDEDGTYHYSCILNCKLYF